MRPAYLGKVVKCRRAGHKCRMCRGDAAVSLARGRGDGWRPHARAQGHMTQHGLASARETVLVVWGHTDHARATG